ncbi:MAG: hypothetical protein ACJ75B_18950 [Flavisolibacter sp.]
MIREILTLTIEEISTPYYIQFEKDRMQFSFQPTLKNKAAPSFIIVVEGDRLVANEKIAEKIFDQACEKIQEIRHSDWYEQF